MPDVLPGTSIFVYWDDLRGRRLLPDILTGDQALAEARRIAGEERDKLRAR